MIIQFPLGVCHPLAWWLLIVLLHLAAAIINMVHHNMVTLSTWLVLVTGGFPSQMASNATVFVFSLMLGWRNFWTNIWVSSYFKCHGTQRPSLKYTPEILSHFSNYHMFLVGFWYEILVLLGSTSSPLGFCHLLYQIAPPLRYVFWCIFSCRMDRMWKGCDMGSISWEINSH